MLGEVVGEVFRAKSSHESTNYAIFAMEAEFTLCILMRLLDVTLDSIEINDFHFFGGVTLCAAQANESCIFFASHFTFDQG